MDKVDLIYETTVRTNDKLDALSDKVSIIEKFTEINTASLQEHMKRSASNEKRLAIIEKRFTLNWVIKHIYSSIIGLSVVSGAIAKILGYF